MYEMSEMVSKTLTPEVITVFGAIACAWLGWKFMGKTASLFEKLFQKDGFYGYALALTFIAGFGSAGFGVGNLAAQKSNPVQKTKGFSDENLIVLANKCDSLPMAKLILDYSAARDSSNNDKVRTTIDLIQNQMNNAENDKEREKYSKSLNTLLEYLLVQQKNNTDYVGLMNIDDTSVSMSASTQQSTSKNEATLPIPFSVCLIGLGAGCMICSVVSYLNRI